MSTADGRGRKGMMRHGSFGFLAAVIVGAGIAADIVGPCFEAGGGDPTIAGQWDSSQAVSRGEHEQPGLAGRRRPNVLVLIADHVNARVVASESQCLKPNLDRLAADGVRFSRCYTPLGMCSPARASLMTATYPSTHGVWDCTHTQRKEWVDVSPKLVHWAQRLVGAGYSTGYFGKWHLTQSDRLEDSGWQEYEIDRWTSMGGPRIPGTEVVSHKEGYRDVAMAALRRDDERPLHHPAYDLGIDFIRRHAAAGKPFCCFVATSEPGGACAPPKRFSTCTTPTQRGFSLPFAMIWQARATCSAACRPAGAT